MTCVDLCKVVWKFKSPGERNWYRPTVAEKAEKLRCSVLVEAYDGILTRRHEKVERPAGRDARIPVERPTWEKVNRRHMLEQSAESVSSAGAAPSDAPPVAEILVPGEGAGRACRSPPLEH